MSKTNIFTIGLVVFIATIFLSLMKETKGSQEKPGLWPDSPFFAKTIEVTPGGILMLRPAIPAVTNRGPINMILSFPDKITLSPLAIEGTDNSSRFNKPLKQILRQNKSSGNLRNELCCQMPAQGMELRACFFDRNMVHFYNESLMRFSGTRDWEHLEWEIKAPESASSCGVIPVFADKTGGAADLGVLSGNLLFKNFSIKDLENNKIIFLLPKTISLAGNSNSYASYYCRVALKADSFADKIQEEHGWIGLNPGKKYLIACDIKTENILLKEKTANIDDVNYVKIIVLNIDKNLQLPETLGWRLEDQNGVVIKEGQVLLTAGKNARAPQKLETSVWIAETALQAETPAIRKLYLQKFRSWGLNTVLPYMPDIDFENPISPEDLDIPIAREAKELGFKTRTYLRFLYDPTAKKYCEDHPEFWATTIHGNKTPDYRVCLTHGLDGGKYDIPTNTVKGGKENPWLGRTYEIVKKSVEFNKLDGIWWDFEIRAAPFFTNFVYKGTLNPSNSNVVRQVCICPRCLRAFQDYLKLDHVPTLPECRTTLYEKWVDFKCGQHIRVWTLMRQAARESNPAANFGIYTGPNGEQTRQCYGVDWGMSGPYLDIAMQRPSFQGGLSVVRDLRKAFLDKNPELKNNPEIINSLQVFHYGDVGRYSQNANRSTYQALPNLKNFILKHIAIGGSYGWSFCGIWGMDDQLIKPIREANALIAEYENYFIEGQKAGNVTLKLGNAEIVSWQNGHKYITVIFNDAPTAENIMLVNDKQREVKLTVPQNDCLVYEW